MFTYTRASEKQQPRSVFILTVDTYYGDADGYETFVMKLSSENELTKRLRELEIVRTQFQYGRGGCRAFYDQTNYFSPTFLMDLNFDDDEAVEACMTENFAWFDRELSEFPYNCDTEQNYTIDGYDVLFYDDQSIAWIVDVSEDMTEFRAKAAELNKNFMANYSKFDSMPGLEERQEHFKNACALVNEGLDV